MRELRSWQTQQKKDKLKVGAEWKGLDKHEDSFVFTTEIGTPLDLTNIRHGSFRRVMERAGLGEWGPERKKPKHGPTGKRPLLQIRLHRVMSFEPPTPALQRHCSPS